LRASAGSGLRFPVLRGMAIPVLLAQLRVAGVKIVAASSHSVAVAGAGAGAAADLREAVAIFIGNEGAGLPAEIEHVADARISIPMSAGVESLNAGVAASVALYEAARQRKGFTTDEH
jgi:TrmH family RNA methyltransferase